MTARKFSLRIACSTAEGEVLELGTVDFGWDDAAPAHIRTRLLSDVGEGAAELARSAALILIARARGES